MDEGVGKRYLAGGGAVQGNANSRVRRPLLPGGVPFAFDIVAHQAKATVNNEPLAGVAQLRGEARRGGTRAAGGVVGPQVQGDELCEAR